jgi:hypothetical protein
LNHFSILGRVVLILGFLLVSCGVCDLEGRQVPAGMGCEESCPNLGTQPVPMEQVVSPVSNPCSDMPLKLLLERWGSTVTFPEPQCPLWVMLTPPHSRVTPRQDCCLFERQTRHVLQQKLQCECTRFFIFCWSRACLPAGEASRWESLGHWVSLPCPGSEIGTDCEGVTP